MKGLRANTLIRWDRTMWLLNVIRDWFNLSYSPRLLWNFLHVFTATNMSSFFTGSPYKQNTNNKTNMFMNR